MIPILTYVEGALWNKQLIASFFRRAIWTKAMKTLNIIFQSRVSESDQKKLSLLLYWPRCRLLYERSNWQLLSWCILKKIMKIQYTPTLQWQFKWWFEYYMVIWIPTFMLTALPKCWKLGPIMASQHNEWCHKIMSFAIQKIFWLSVSFKMTSQKWRYRQKYVCQQKQCQCYLTLS